MKMFIIEDNPEFSSAVERVAKEEFEINKFTSCADAISAIGEENLPDVILTDIYVGNQDGLAMVEEMQRRKVFRPTIAISGRPDTKLTLRAIELGIFAFLVKPFALERFQAALHKAKECRKRQLQRDTFEKNLPLFLNEAEKLITLYDRRILAVENALFAGRHPYFPDTKSTREFLDLVRDSFRALQDYRQAEAKMEWAEFLANAPTSLETIIDLRISPNHLESKIKPISSESPK